MKGICRRIDNRTLPKTDGKTIRGSVNPDVSTEVLYDGQLLCCLPLYADFDKNKNAPSITGYVVQPVPYEDSNFTCPGWFCMLGQNDIDDLLGVCVDENDIRFGKSRSGPNLRNLSKSLFFADAMIGIIPDFGTCFGLLVLFQ